MPSTHLRHVKTTFLLLASSITWFLVPVSSLFHLCLHHYIRLILISIDNRLISSFNRCVVHCSLKPDWALNHWSNGLVQTWLNCCFGPVQLVWTLILEDLAAFDQFHGSKPDQTKQSPSSAQTKFNQPVKSCYTLTRTNPD